MNSQQTDDMTLPSQTQAVDTDGSA